MLVLLHNIQINVIMFPLLPIYAAFIVETKKTPSSKHTIANKRAYLASTPIVHMYVLVDEVFDLSKYQILRKPSFILFIHLGLRKVHCENEFLCYIVDDSSRWFTWGDFSLIFLFAFYFCKHHGLNLRVLEPSG